ncbi:beta strand repeat-containing protein [Bifidobacterium scaligerum]|uniref:Gram-positive cocci surface proteins LPxTG domain-containing protein n=1 Tax=Bifidobacterium scaligerum TaxID=2052656 RepID=A0A2M9HPF0_9BIFI|nr:hypothetical protein [Bifidobacterium scaligerum]PJM78687.1 hypothetical protein CUU80_08095 [Bifidobacterium scaligerum]
MNSLHTKKNWLKPVIGVAVSVAALAMGASAVVANAAPEDNPDVQASASAANTVTSTRTFKVVKQNDANDAGDAADNTSGDANNGNTDGDNGTADGTGDAGNNPDASATTPSMNIAVYAAGDNGVVADGTKPLTSGATNASTVRLGITLSNDAGFPTDDSFDKDGKYTGAQKDQSALAIDVEPLGGRFNISYGDFTKVTDADGKVTGYEVKPNDGPSLALNGDSGTKFTITVDTPVYDAAQETPLDLSKFVDAEGNSTIVVPELTHDTTKPDAVSGAKFNDDATWLKSKDGAKWLTTAAPTVTFTAPADAAKLTLTDKSGDKPKSQDLTAGDAGYTWTLPEGSADLTKFSVTATDAAGNVSDSAILTDLLKAADANATVQTAVVDTKAGNLTLKVNGKPADGKDVNGAKYYQSVTGFSVTSESDYFDTELALLKDNNIKLLTTGAGDKAVAACDVYTAKDKVVDCGTAGLDLKDGNFTVALNDKLPGLTADTAQSKTFSIDGTAPTVSSVTYGADKNNDLAGANGEVIAFGDAKRTLIFTLTDSGAGITADDASAITLKGTGALTDLGASKARDLKADDYDVAVAQVADADGNPVAGKYTVTVTLKAAASYDFSKISIAVKDQMGNDTGDTALNKIAGAALPTPLTIAGALNVTTKLAVAKNADGKDAVDGADGLKWYNKPATVKATVAGNPLASKIVEALKNSKDVAVTSTLNGKAQDAVTLGDLTVTAGKNGEATVTWSVRQPDADGEYTFGIANTGGAASVNVQRLFGTADIAGTSFGVDTTDPTVDSVTYAADANDFKASDKETIAFGADADSTASRTLTFALSDVGSGITDGDASAIKLNGKVTDLGATEARDLKAADYSIDAVTAATDENGADVAGKYNVTVTLKATGSYDFSSITVQVNDKVNNSTLTNIDAIATKNDLPSVLTIAGKLSAIDTKLEVVKDADGKDAADGADGLKWYNKPVTVKATITGNPLATKIASALSKSTDAAVTRTFNGNATDIALGNLAVTADKDGNATVTWAQLSDDGEYAFKLADNPSVDVQRLFGTNGVEGVNFGVDTTPAKVTAVTYTPEGTTEELNGTTIYINGTAKLIIAASDADANGKGSGIAKVTLDNVQFSKVDADGNESAPVAKSFTATDNGDGTYTVELTAAGTYSFSGATAVAQDKVSNVAEAFDVAGQDSFKYTKFMVSNNNVAEDLYPSITVKPDATDIDGVATRNTLDGIALTSKSTWFKSVIDSLPNDPDAGEPVVASGTSETGAKYKLYAGPVSGPDKNGVFTLSVDTKDFDALPDAQKNGNHTITLVDKLQDTDTPTSVKFRFDNTAATVTGIAYDANNGVDQTIEDGDIITADGNTTRYIHIKAADLLPGHGADQAAADADQVSGLANDKEVVVKEDGATTTLPYDAATDSYTLTLNKADHRYDMSTMYLTVTDRIGNVTVSKSLKALADDLADSTLKGIDSITISNADADKAIKTTILVNGKQDVNGKYLNLKDGDAIPTIQLKVEGNTSFASRWKAVKKHYKNAAVITSKLATTGEGEAYGACVLDTSTEPVKSGDAYLITCKPADGKKALLSGADNGMYTLTFALSGTYDSSNKEVAALQTLFGALEDGGKVGYTAQSVQIGVDHEAPSFTGLTYNGKDTDLADNAKTPAKLLANGQRTITFSVHDLLANKNAASDAKSDANNTSGLDENSVKATAKITGFDGKVGKEEQLAVAKNADGTFTMTLADNGIYELKNISITASDRAWKIAKDGTVSADVNTVDKATSTLAELKKALKANGVPDSIAVSTAAGTTQTLINGAKVAATYNKSIDSLSLKITDDPAFGFRSDILTSDAYKNTDVFTGSTVTYAAKPDGVELNGLTFGNGEFDKSAGTITWSGDTLAKFIKPLDRQNGQVNGDYVLGTQLSADSVTLLASPAKASFVLDTVNPQITKISAAKGTKGTDLVENYEVNGTKYNVYAKAGQQQFVVSVKDLLPAEQRAKGDRESDAKNELGTSGITDNTVIYTIPAPTDLAGKTIGTEVRNKTAVVDATKGTFTITLAQEGFYDLAKITVTAKDKAGNEMKANSVLDGNGEEEVVKDGINYNAIVADVNDDNSVRLKVSKASDYADSTVAGYYFRGKTVVDYEVTDKWFPLYQQLNQLHGNLLAGSTGDTAPQDANAGVTGIKGLKVTDAGWSQVGETYTWKISGQQVVNTNQNDEVEGRYGLNFAYSGLNAKKQVTKQFVMDWTAPKLGNLTSSVTSPAKWKWIFANNAVTVTLNGVTDPISGICSARAASTDGNDCSARNKESVAFSALGFDNRLADAAAHPAPQVTYNGSAASGSISFSFSGDSQRLTLGNTSIKLTDAAGNPVDTGALNQYAGVNGTEAANNIKNVDGIAIDTVAPTVSLAYDNNDVRNGKYYKAHRTGTVTLVDSNFDFSVKNEPGRVIVTTTVDGAKTTVPVSAFTNLNGDRKTYVASFGANSDGDWVVDIAYTDPGEHASNTIHDEFTVDTIAPKLALTFDNNSAKNGMYYDADRTATVKEVERNFSDGESVITVTAKDDKGADAAAPGPSGWSRTGGERESTEWTNTVAFTGEAHFTIKATATDLAGNVAEEVSEPEFVIDKTKPQIKIDRVEDKTAYAGTVAPLIDFDDTNIDMNNVTYTLVGAHRGDLKGENLPRSITTNSDNTRTVDFTDFDRKVDVDDVYTIKATATDMAGNKFEAQKTFSVNRFGSTYMFDSDTTNLRGAYLKKASNVVITEINVSGLDPTTRQVVVAKDDKATTLKAGDFTAKSSDDRGWSRTIYTVPASYFSSDGYYRVQVQSVDEAGNLSQNTMDKKDEERKGNAEVNFALDSTAPTASLLGVRSGSVYYDQQGHNVSIDSKDNLALDSTEVYVDGQLKGSWKGAELLKSTPSMTLDADAKAHEIVIHTIDKAGNEATATYDNVYVASNWWQYAMHTGWIRNTMVFGALLALAAIAGAIIWASQRRKNAR